MRSDWLGKRVLILGAARQGLALARWLSIHGAHVTLSDTRSADELRIARESLAEYPIEWALRRSPACAAGLHRCALPLRGCSAHPSHRGRSREARDSPLEQLTDLHGSRALQDHRHYRLGRQDDHHDPGWEDGCQCLWRPGAHRRQHRGSADQLCGQHGCKGHRHP